MTGNNPTFTPEDIVIMLNDGTLTIDTFYNFIVADENEGKTGFITNRIVDKLLKYGTEISQDKLNAFIDSVEKIQEELSDTKSTIFRFNAMTIRKKSFGAFAIKKEENHHTHTMIQILNKIQKTLSK